MPFDPTGAIESIQRSLGGVPAAILAIAFLAGPTLAWLLYRFVVRPHTSRYANGGEDLLWLCSRCRSANAVRARRCYRCGLAQTEIEGDLQIVDGGAIVALTSEGTSEGPGPSPAEPTTPPVAPPLVAMGPGRTPTFPRADISAASMPVTAGVPPVTGLTNGAVAPSDAEGAANEAIAPRKVTTSQRRTARKSTGTTDVADGNGTAGKQLVGVGPGPAPEPAAEESLEPVTVRKPRRPRTGARSTTATKATKATKASAGVVVEPPPEEA